VDDDAAIRGLVRMLLRRDGLAVDEAAGGQDAITLLEERDYDAIVLDMMMRNGSGEDVLDVLGEKGEQRNVIVISAIPVAKLDDLTHPRVRTKFQKPFDIHELMDAVRECCSARGDT
jgi:two-component system, OmpR family, response regulator VicR